MPRVLAIGLELFADLEAAQLGHHHVEQDQVGLERGHFGQGVATVDRHGNFAVEAAQIGLEQLDVRPVVVGDQDPAFVR